MQVSDLYDGPDVVLVTFPAKVTTAFPGLDLMPAQSDVYLKYMAHLELLLTARDNLKVHFLHLNGDNIETDDFCVSHPNLAAHEEYASQFIAFLNQAVPDWAQSTYAAM